MKKTLLASLVVMLISSAADARDISSGTVMITGNTNITDTSTKIDYSSGSETDDSTSINVASLYFVTNNVGVGVLYGREYSKASNATTVKKTTTDGVGPAVGYNISINQDISLLLHTEYLWANGTIEPGNGNNLDIDGHATQLGGALNYFINDRVAVSLGVVRAWESVDLKFTNGSTGTAKYALTSTSLGMTMFF